LERLLASVVGREGERPGTKPLVKVPQVARCSVSGLLDIEPFILRRFPGIQRSNSFGIFRPNFACDLPAYGGPLLCL
jgi:hypothetical protein